MKLEITEPIFNSFTFIWCIIAITIFIIFPVKKENIFSGMADANYLLL